MDYTASGRVGQKQRTRELVLEAARRLIQAGEAPGVEDAAEAAGVSRATAYRYFPTQAQLVAAAFPETVVPAVSDITLSSDPVERVLAVAAIVIERIERTEQQQRLMLRLSLDDSPRDLPLRQGRVIDWFIDALEPRRAELGDAGLRDLAVALRSVCGIESRVWLRDIARLDSASIRAVQLWMVEAIVVRADTDPPPSLPPRP